MLTLTRAALGSFSLNTDLKFCTLTRTTREQSHRILTQKYHKLTSIGFDVIKLMNPFYSIWRPAMQWYLPPWLQFFAHNHDACYVVLHITFFTSFLNKNGPNQASFLFILRSFHNTMTNIAQIWLKLNKSLDFFANRFLFSIKVHVTIC